MLITSTGAGLALLDVPLFAYRQHAGQYSGGVAGMIRLSNKIGSTRKRRAFNTMVDEAVLA